MRFSLNVGSYFHYPTLCIQYLTQSKGRNFSSWGVYIRYEPTKKRGDPPVAPFGAVRLNTTIYKSTTVYQVLPMSSLCNHLDSCILNQDQRLKIQETLVFDLEGLNLSLVTTYLMLGSYLSKLIRLIMIPAAAGNYLVIEIGGGGAALVKYDVPRGTFILHPETCILHPVSLNIAVHLITDTLVNW